MKRLFSMLCCAAMLFACGKNDAPEGDNGGTGGNGGDTPNETPEATFFSNDFMRGTTMCFAQYEMDLGLKYRENGVETNPYASLKAHGGNIVRLQLNYEDFPQYQGATIDWASRGRVFADAQTAFDHELDLLLTLKPDADTYNDTAASHNIVPADWRSLNETQLGDALYDWVYGTLCDLAARGIFPRAVAVGNEVSVGFLKPSASSAADAVRTSRLLRRGFAAVRDYAKAYNPKVLSILHIDNPSIVEWFVGQLTDNGCADFDIVATSWYPGTDIGHTMGTGDYATFGGMCRALKNRGYGFMILETACTFATGTVDGVWMGDYCDNSYYFPDWDDAVNAVNYTPAKQREWLGNLAREVKSAGGAGVVTWGTESLPDLREGKVEGHGLGLYTYPAKWGYGSTWENNSYWDFTDGNNLHEGIDWMQDVK